MSTVRKSSGLILGLVILGGPSSALAASPASSAGAPLPPLVDVPEYRADARHTSEYPGPGPIEQPVLVWSRSTGSSISFNAVLEDGVLLAGTTDGMFFALDGRTGAERWRTKVGSTILGSGSASDGVVVFGEDAGVLHAFEVATGRELWWHSVPGIRATVIADGVVYASGDTVVGLDLHDGTQRWSWTGPARTDYVAVAGDTLYAGVQDGFLHALALSDASERWSVELASVNVGYPMIGPDTLYITTVTEAPNGELYAIDPATGAIRWRFQVPSTGPVGNGAMTDGMEYSGSVDDGIFALREQAGPDGEPQVVWHVPVDGQIYRNADRVGDVLYFGVSSPGALLAVTISGQILWNVPLGPSPNSIMVTGGMIFGGDEAGDLFAYAEPSLAAAIGPVASGPLNTDVIAHAPNDPFSVVADWSPEVTGLGAIVDLDIGPDGLAYVIDDRDRVVVVDLADGHPVRSWGTKGSSPGQFDLNTTDGNPGIGSIAVGADGDVYVGDGNNYRFQVFGPDGSFIRQVGSFGTTPGRFSRVAGIAVGQDGSVYVTDDLGTLSTFDADGRLVWRDGGSGDEVQFPGLLQTTIARRDGRLFQVIEEGPILELDPATGAVIDRWDIGPTVALGFDSAGNAYSTDFQPPAVQVWDPEHHLLGGAYGPESIRVLAIGPGDEVLSWWGSDGHFQVLAVDLPQ